jgi:hypothetical protein
VGVRRIPRPMGVKDEAQAEFENAVGFAIDELYRHPLVAAHPLEAVTIGTTRTAVPHKQGRTPTGWIPFNVEGDATVWQDAPADDRYFYLIASASVRCRILVF